MSDESVHVIIDCATGTEQVAPLTPEEMARKAADDKAVNDASQAAQEARDADLAVLKASKSSAVQALLRLLDVK